MWRQQKAARRALASGSGTHVEDDQATAIAKAFAESTAAVAAAKEEAGKSGRDAWPEEVKQLIMALLDAQEGLQNSLPLGFNNPAAGRDTNGERRSGGAAFP